MGEEQKGTMGSVRWCGRNTSLHECTSDSTLYRLVLKAIILAASLALCAYSAGYEVPAHLSLRSQPDVSTESDQLPPIKTCQQCALKLSTTNRAALDSTTTLVVPRSNAFGRTGNFVTIVTHAIHISRACGYKLVLPLEDELAAFDLQANYAVYDFQDGDGGKQWPLYRGGRLVDPANHCPKLVQMDGRTRMKEVFMYYIPKTNDIEVDNCVRQYLGLCVQGYCDALTKELSNSLVIHIRQGDAFKHNFSPKVLPTYWQPPLDYYLAAIHFQKWDALHILSQPTETEYNPVLLMLRILNHWRMLPAPTSFLQYDTNRTWADDVRTMVCAPNIVMSKSTLGALVRLGRARQVFALTCFQYKEDDPNVHAYEIPLAGEEKNAVYLPSLNHTNSPAEWVQMLLHRLPKNPVRRCKDGLAFAPLY